MTRLFIVAETREQARRYARENDVKSWLHVRRELDVLGRTVKEYVLVGTWYNLQNINFILDALERSLDQKGFEERAALRGL
jgi:hypothetical protein